MKYWISTITLFTIKIVNLHYGSINIYGHFLDYKKYKNYIQAAFQPTMFNHYILSYKGGSVTVLLGKSPGVQNSNLALSITACDLLNAPYQNFL